MPRRKHTINLQKEHLVQFMEQNHSVLCGRIRSSGTTSTSSRHLKWNAIKDELNSIGPSKDVNEWKKCWRNMTHKASAKATRIRQYMNFNGGAAPIDMEVMSPMDEKIVKILGVKNENDFNPDSGSDESSEDLMPFLENANAKPEVETPPEAEPLDDEDVSEKTETEVRAGLTEPGRKYSTNAQKVLMVEFMEQNHLVLCGKRPSGTSTNARRLMWSTIRDELNLVGPSKDVNEWKKCWRNLKNKAKTKAATIQKEIYLPGANPVELELRLSSMYAKILTIIGDTRLQEITNIPDDESGSEEEYPGDVSFLENETSETEIPLLKEAISDTLIDVHSCRVCLVRSSVNMEFLFSNDEQVISLAEKINQYSEIPMITRNDGFAQYICGVCREMLKVATRFRELCKQSDQEMRTMQHPNEFKMEEHEGAEYLLDGSDEDEIKFETIYTSAMSPNSDQDVTDPPEDYKTLKGLSRSEHWDKILKSKIPLKPPMHWNDLPSSDKTYPCLQCNITFRREHNYRIHLRNHLKEQSKQSARIYSCEHCGKTLKTAKTLKHHILTHDLPSSARTLYPCLQCDKRFRQERNLHRHVQNHRNNDRPFVCEVCGKTFKYRAQIKMHLENHQNIRNFACSQCPYRTLTRSSLKIHERSHTGQRPFECPVCSQTFTTSSNRMKHVHMIHDKRKTHACEVCGRLFFESIGVRKHMAVHSAIKRFECRHCPSVYGHMSGLVKHMRKLHPGLKPPSLASFFVNERPTSE